MSFESTSVISTGCSFENSASLSAVYKPPKPPPRITTREAAPEAEAEDEAEDSASRREGRLLTAAGAARKNALTRGGGARVSSVIAADFRNQLMPPLELTFFSDSDVDAKKSKKLEKKGGRGFFFLAPNLVRLTLPRAHVHRVMRERAPY